MPVLECIFSLATVSQYTYISLPSFLTLWWISFFSLTCFLSKAALPLKPPPASIAAHKITLFLTDISLAGRIQV